MRYALLMFVVIALASCASISKGVTKTTPTIAQESNCMKPSPFAPGANTQVSLVTDPALAHGATKRTYYIHVPTGYRPNVPLPIVLDFHGKGGTAAGEATDSGFSQLADQEHFLAVYPQGLIDSSSGAPFWASIGKLDYGIDEIAFVNAVLDDVQQKFCVDSTRIYATGFSNGGAMSAFLACRLADRIAAVTSIAGNYYHIPGGCHPGRAVSILDIHGTADPIVPYDGIPYANNTVFWLPSISTWLQSWATRIGCTTTPTVFLQTGQVMGEQWQNCQDNANIVHYRINQGGHGCPSEINGQPCAQVIWQFFKSHSLSAKPVASPLPTHTTISEHALPQSNSFPTSIVAGPDGALWFTENLWYATAKTNNIGKIAPSGVITQFPVAINQILGDIAAGPDGALWFTEATGNNIWRMTANGASTSFALPQANSLPSGIVAGTDGALWFTEANANQIGRITVDGAITQFPIPHAGAGPAAITVGPDHALWFTEVDGNAIGRIDLHGVLTEFAIPTPQSQPMGITSGADGALWFTEMAGNHIGRITVTGSMSEFALPTPQAGPTGICAGPDGNLWFTEGDANAIGRITTAGKVTEFATPTALSGPASIITGPDGALWFTEMAQNAIGRLKP